MSFIQKFFRLFSNSKIIYPKQYSPFEARLPSLNEKQTESLIVYFANWEFIYEDFDFNLDDKDDLFIIASRYVVREQNCSTSLLQDKLFLTYQFASYFISQMERYGIVGPFKGNDSWEVLISDEASLNQFLWDIYEEERSIFGTNLMLDRDDFASPQIIDFIEEHRDIIKKRREEGILERQKEEEWLEKDEIKKRILEKERKKQLEREAMSELIEEGVIFNTDSNQMKREPIPQDVKDRVWNRDGGKCVKCGSTEKLEFDHIIPISKGGANTYRNLQLLCENCNRTKSNKIG